MGAMFAEASFGQVFHAVDLAKPHEQLALKCIAKIFENHAHHLEGSPEHTMALDERRAEVENEVRVLQLLANIADAHRYPGMVRLLAFFEVSYLLTLKHGLYLLVIHPRVCLT